MPPPLDPELRDLILGDIQAVAEGTSTLSRNAIARAHGVAATTVTAIARAEGLTGAFDRTQTKNATEAAAADAKAERAALRQLLRRRAREALEAMDAPFIVAKIGGKDNVYTEQLVDGPPTADMRNLMIIAATAIDKDMAIDRYDSDQQNLSAFDVWLAEMMGAAGAAGAATTDPVED